MTTRISGLASGMDIDSMVKSLMKAESIPLDKLKQKKQTLEWQRDDYRSMNTLLLNFRSSLTQMKLSTNYRARTTTSTDDTKITTTATSSAAQSSYSISKVDQLATAATKVNTGSVAASGKKIDVNKDLFSSTTGTDKDFAAGLTWLQGSVETKTINGTGTSTEISLDLPQGVVLKDPSSMNVKVDGKTYTINTTATTPADLKDNEFLVNSTTGKLSFNKNIAATSSVKVDYITDNKIETVSMKTGASAISLSKGSISKINSITVKDDSGSTPYTVDASWNVMSGSTKVGTVDSKTGKITFDTATAKDATVEVNYQQNYSVFNVATHTSKGDMNENIIIQGSDSLNSVINKVNASSVGVSMFFDDNKQQVALTRTETGNFGGKDSLDPTKTAADQEITTTGDFINTVLNFSGAAETGGDNAKFTINGLSTERSSNTFNMNGVTFNLKKTFTDAPVTVSIGNDSDKVLDNVKKFITSYNDLIDAIQKKTSEERDRDYGPLTDDQKEQLSDKQQEQWEAKAKSGLLRKDSTLTGLLSKMRSDFYSPVDSPDVSSSFKQLASIGITTTANYLEGGKLQIDEAKLKQAIESDSQSVEKLFTASGSSTGQQGIVQRLYDTVNNGMDQIKAKAGNTYSTNKQFVIGKDLDDVTTSITSFQARLKQVEDRYYNQFNAMEQAMQKANQQSAYITQQLSGGS